MICNTNGHQDLGQILELGERVPSEDGWVLDQDEQRSIVEDK
jgi:hypothetical protein